MSAGLFLGAFAAYRSAHPPVPDEKLREYRREKVRRLRRAVERWRREDPVSEGDMFWYTTERTELTELMTGEEEEEFRDAGPREQMEVAQRVLTRLEREWALV